MTSFEVEERTEKERAEGRKGALEGELLAVEGPEETEGTLKREEVDEKNGESGSSDDEGDGDEEREDVEVEVEDLRKKIEGSKSSEAPTRPFPPPPPAVAAAVVPLRMLMALSRERGEGRGEGEEEEEGLLWRGEELPNRKTGAAAEDDEGPKTGIVDALTVVETEANEEGEDEEDDEEEEEDDDDEGRGLRPSLL